MDREVLSDDELKRYSRHLSLPGIGIEGQKRIKKSSVLIVGVGGLGSITALMLACAGVGRIGLIDHDKVELSNLQRQILYTPENVNNKKVTIAKDRLLAHNPDIAVEVYPTRLTEDNANGIIGGYDLVLDGTDNIPTRKIVNQSCVELDKPFIFGAVSYFDGQVSVFHASRGPCYACFLPETEYPIEQRKERNSVISTLPGIVGALQATEALKIICNLGELLIGKLLIINSLASDFHHFEIQKKKNCPICGKLKSIVK